MRVTIPPKIVPKAKGINTTAGDRLASTDDWIATGISNARAPTLFMTVEINPPREDKTATWRDGEKDVAPLT